MDGVSRENFIQQRNTRQNKTWGGVGELIEYNLRRFFKLSPGSLMDWGVWSIQFHGIPWKFREKSIFSAPPTKWGGNLNEITSN